MLTVAEQPCEVGQAAVQQLLRQSIRSCSLPGCLCDQEAHIQMLHLAPQMQRALLRPDGSSGTAHLQDADRLLIDVLCSVVLQLLNPVQATRLVNLGGVGIGPLGTTQLLLSLAHLQAATTVNVLRNLCTMQVQALPPGPR